MALSCVENNPPFKLNQTLPVTIIPHQQPLGQFKVAGHCSLHITMPKI